MSDPVEKPVVVIGRTPYDAAVDIVRLLGRAAPWFVFLAGFLYAAQQIYAVNQSKEVAVQQARVDATKEQNAQIVALNDRLRENDKSLEELRGHQIGGLEQLLKLTQAITDAIAKSQAELLTQRDALLAASKKSQEAEQSLAAATAKTRDLEAQRDELAKQAAKAMDVMDTAARVLNYLDNRGAPATERSELSRRFENDDPARISADGHGKYFYGAFRLPGDEMADFLTWLDKQDAERAAPFLAAGGGAAAAKGTREFQDQWRKASSDRSFERLQSVWIDTEQYAPFIKRLAKTYPDLNDQAIGKWSVALQAVLWSVVNQYGKNSPIVRNAWGDLRPSAAADLVLICRIYVEERGKTRMYFPDEAPTTYTLLNARYRFEQEEAMRMLKAATNMTDDPKCE